MDSILAFVFIISYWQFIFCFQCKDTRNNDVDWFLVYKLPRINSLRGNEFVYLDERNPTWIGGEVTIQDNDKRNPVYNTLQQIYDGDFSETSNNAYGIYNDQPPPTRNSRGSYGHTKGAFAMENGGNGFWMISSIPGFPPKKDGGYSYPDTGKRYGQNLFCITFPLKKQKENLVDIMTYTKPFFYDKFTNMNNPNDRLYRLFYRQREVSERHNSKTITLTSKGGKSFKCFVKSPTTKNAIDIYENMIADDRDIGVSMQHPLYVQSFRRLKEATNSKVKDISFKEFDRTNLPGLQNTCFNNTKDHSKWAIATKDEKWFCISDLNREESQRKRGGAAVCFDNPGVYDAYKRLIVNRCPRPLPDRVCLPPSKRIKKDYMP